MQSTVSELDVIELTKQEALEIKDLHTRLTFAQLVFQSGYRELCKIYGVSEEEYQLHLALGQLIKNEKPNKEKE